MKKKRNKMPLLARVKRIIREIIALDMQMNGKISSLIFAIMCFLAMVLIIIIVSATKGL